MLSPITRLQWCQSLSWFTLERSTKWQLIWQPQKWRFVSVVLEEVIASGETRLLFCFFLSPINTVRQAIIQCGIYHWCLQIKNKIKKMDAWYNVRSGISTRYSWNIKRYVVYMKQSSWITFPIISLSCQYNAFNRDNSDINLWNMK